MSSNFKRPAVAIAAILISTYCSNAQVQTSSYEVGISAGTLVYQGDLTPAYFGNYKSLKPSVGLYVSKSLSPYFSLRGNLVFGKIKADESKVSDPEWRQHRNFKFSSPVTEFTASIVFNPYGENNAEVCRRLTPYVFAGAGVSFVNVNRDWRLLDTSYFSSKSPAVIGLASDTVHATPRELLILPFGAGLKYAIGPHFSLFTEATYRLTTSDYVDGFKYAGNSKKRDTYYGLAIGLSYKFGSDRYRCPTVKL